MTYRGWATAVSVLHHKLFSILMMHACVVIQIRITFIAVLATIDSDIQSVTITEKESANFTCNFSKGDLSSTVYWTVDGEEHRDCVTAEEDIGPDSNGCYTIETQSVLLIRNTSSLTPGRRHQVQCILQQNIPQEYRDDDSFKEEYETLTRTAFLTTKPTGGSASILYDSSFQDKYSII